MAMKFLPLSLPSPAYLLRASFMIALSFSLAARPALAQSILRDAETEIFLEEISAPLAKAAGLAPDALEIVLVHDANINAFVAGGQRIYIHTGLIEAAGSANELQGVIAHELGHIEGGHVIRSEEGSRPAMAIMLLSMLAGIGAAAAGAPDAAVAGVALGQSLAIQSFFRYSQGQESTADASGARYLSAAGITGRGSVEFFKKLQNYEFRLGRTSENNYATTHPLTSNRILVLDDAYRADPAWDAPLNPKWEADFVLLKAKLMGYVQAPSKIFAQYPPSDQSRPALYARAYAYQRSQDSASAIIEAQKLVDWEPSNPFFQELLGQLLLESGKAQEALFPLRKATGLSRTQPLIAGLFGHALVATEQESNYAEAEQVLRSSVARDPENPDAWLQLGIIYHARGDDARAALAGAERHYITGDPGLAYRDAQEAMRALPEYSPDWIRAQDISLLAEEEQRKRLKKR